MVKLVRGDHVVISTNDNPSWFSGFVTHDPEYDYLGKAHEPAPPYSPTLNEPTYGFKYKASSDEFVLSLRSLGLVKPFLNLTQGAILKALVTILDPNEQFTTTGIQDGLLLATYIPDPTKTFNDIVKEFCEHSNYRFYSDNFILYFEKQDTTPAPIIIDGLSKHFTPARLEINSSNDPVINDVTVFGDIEPQGYVTEYFVGDGFTAEFPLLSDVYGVERSILLDETYSGTDLDTSRWIRQDPTDQYIRVDSGALQFLGGLNSWDEVYAEYLSPIPIEGNLRLTHGEFDFPDSGNGVICGLWTGAISGGTSSANCTSFPNCVYGIRVTPSGSEVKLQPIINGVVDSSQSITCEVHGGAMSKRYIIRTLLSADEIKRHIMARAYLLRTGNVGTYGGYALGAKVWFETTITEIDATTGKATTNSVTFTNPATTLSGSQLFAFYVPGVSYSLHMVVTNTTISVPLQANLSIFRAGKADPSLTISNDPENYGWKSRLHKYRQDTGEPIEFQVTENYNSDGLGSGLVEKVWKQKIVGPNEIDSGDGLAPDATITTTNSGKTDRGSLLSSPKYNSGSAKLVFFKDSVKQTTTIPKAGDLIRIQYRRAGIAIGRARSSDSIAIEAALFGDSGIRNITKKDLDPIPRTSEECEMAAAALLQDLSYQHYEGSYTQFNVVEFSGDPAAGQILRFQNLPSILPQFQSEVIQEVVSSVEGITTTGWGEDGGPVSPVNSEVIQHVIKFGRSDKVKKLLRSFSKPQGFITPDDSVVVPSEIEISSGVQPSALSFVWGDITLDYSTFDTTTYVVPVYTELVKEFYLYSWTSYIFPVFGAAESQDLNVFHFRVGSTRPSGGGFEFRWMDAGWKENESIVPHRTLVQKGASQAIASPRTKRGKTLFVKAYDGEGRYSRWASAIRAEFPDFPPRGFGITRVGGDLIKPLYRANLPVDEHNNPILNTSIYGLEEYYAYEIPITGWEPANGAAFGTSYVARDNDNPGAYKYNATFAVTDPTYDGFAYTVINLTMPANSWINFGTIYPVLTGKAVFFVWLNGGESGGQHLRLNLKNSAGGSYAFFSRQDVLLNSGWNPVYTYAYVFIPSSEENATYNLVIHNIGSTTATLKMCLPFICLNFYNHQDIVLGASEQQPGLQFTYDTSVTG
jgi:hypothetical protein